MSDFAVEFFYDILGIGFLVSIHHRLFKPKKRYRFDSAHSVPESKDNEHISIYEDEETSMRSGTIRHTVVD